MHSNVRTVFTFPLPDFYYANPALRPTELESDVGIQEVTIGQGIEALPYSDVDVHYTGRLEEGTVFRFECGSW